MINYYFIQRLVRGYGNSQKLDDEYLQDIIVFLKEFIQTRNYRKLLIVEEVLSFYYDDKYVLVDVIAKYRDKKGEYQNRQIYTLFIKDILEYYKIWSRDKQLSEILNN